MSQIPNRAYDHIYDPVYTTSTRNSRSAATGASSSTYIRGNERYKFCKSSLLPSMNSAARTAVLDRRGPEDQFGHSSSMSKATTGADRRDRVRTVGVQTRYRESEAQTDPFTPNFILPRGKANPEILSLAHVEAPKYGEQFHPKEEVEKIEYARYKARFEQSLPPMTDELSFELRKRMMERQEQKEWNRREAQIEAQNAKRLEALRAKLLERERSIHNINTNKISQLKEKSTCDRNMLATEIHRKRIKNLRKLATKRGNAQSHIFEARPIRNIIKEYSRFDSSVYAPKKRDGEANETSRSGVSRYYADNQATTLSFGTLVDLESTLPKSFTTTQTMYPLTGSTKSSRHTTTQSRSPLFDPSSKNDGTSSIESLPPEKETPSTTATTRKQKKTKAKKRRPPTPRVVATEGNADDVAFAFCLLQRLLRGRAVQNMMAQARHRHSALIKELRSDVVYCNSPKVNSSEDANAEHREWDQSEALESTREKLVGEVVSNALLKISGS